MITTALLLAAALFAPPSVPELPDRGEPMKTTAYTADLRAEGYRNGHLAAELLAPVPSSEPSCVVEREAAEAWTRLLSLAAVEGIALEAGWCYRTFDQQVRTYDRNCPITDIDVERVVQVETKKGKKKKRTLTTKVQKRVCSAPTADPGRSNHGWGRAIDATSNGKLLTCRSQAFWWLTKHAKDYGWVHPWWARCGAERQEPWHWEWGGTIETQFRAEGPPLL